MNTNILIPRRKRHARPPALLRIARWLEQMYKRLVDYRDYRKRGHPPRTAWRMDMKYLAALLLMLYSAPLVPKQLDAKWWEPGIFGACTKTDIKELGGCFQLEVRRRPRWRKQA